MSASSMQQQPPPPPPAHVCRECGTADGKDGEMRTCSRCKHTKYCSTQCQKKHWKRVGAAGHKQSCHPSPRWSKALSGPQQLLAFVDAVAESAATGRLSTDLAALPAGFAVVPTAAAYVAVEDREAMWNSLCAATCGIGLAACWQEMLPLLKPDDDGVLRVHFIGARGDPAFSQSEAFWDWPMIHRVVTASLPSSTPFKTLKVGLVGPGMAKLDDATKARLKAAEKACGGGLVIQVSPRAYHVRPPPPPHAAILIGPGIDLEFASWAPTLQLLLTRRTPTAMTGYDTFAAHGCCDAQGCERLLELFGANFLLRTTKNPFGIPMPGSQYVMSGFVLAVCGSEREQRVEDIAGIHRSERIAKLEDFAVAQEHDSMGLGAVELRQLAAELVADTVDIPSEVTHNQIEDWSFGNGPKLWTTKLKVAG